MSYVHKPGTGRLFYSKSDNPKAPVRTGYIMTPEGRRLRLSGWIVTGDDGHPRKDKDGNPMLSLKAEWDNQYPPAVQETLQQTGGRVVRDERLDDEIPF